MPERLDILHMKRGEKIKADATAYFWQVLARTLVAIVE